MSQKSQFTILEFSRLTGIKRENLRYYDRIGLLSPETRGENNYRHYSRHQLNTAYLISSLRGLGVGIADIKRYAVQRSPEESLALFAQQDARIEVEIRQLRETRLILQMYADMVKEAIASGEDALFLQEKEQEAIFLCPPIPAYMDDDEGGIFSYEYAEKHGVNLGFPQGVMVKRDVFVDVDATWSSRYYFKVGSGGNACKPKGRYAVAYGRCDPWKPEALYARLFDFIKAQGLHICGDAYEEYPLNDQAEQAVDQYCLRVEVPVREQTV